MKFRGKLITIFLALSILPLALSSYIAFDNAGQTIEQNTYDRLMAINVLKVAELDQWIDGSTSILELQASRPLVREYVAKLVDLDPEDAEFQATRTKLVEDHLAPLTEEVEGFLDVFLIRASDGLVLVSTDNFHEGKYRENEAYFIQGLRDSYVDEVVYEVTHGEPVMHISTPIRSPEGQVVAVLAGHVDLNKISDIMARGIEMSATQETYLVNSFNFFVTDSRFETGAALAQAIYTDGVADCLQGHTGEGLYTDYRGIPVIGAYHWLPERKLCIVTEINQEEAFAPIRELGRKALVLAVIATLVASVIGVFFSQSLTEPLERLAASTQQMAEGNLSHRVEIHRRDELGRLGEAFNQMVSSLETSQKELHASEEKYRTLIEGADAAISTITHDGTFLFMNTQAARQLGGKPADFVGKTMRDLFPPEIAERQLRSVQAVIKEGTSRSQEAPSVVDGQTRWYNARLQPLLDASGKIEAAMLIAYDITSRKEAELALEEERQFVQAIMDTAKALIIVLNPEGKVIRFNWACEELTGYTFDEIKDKYFWDFLLLPEDRELARDAYLGLRIDDLPDNLEGDWIIKNGERRTIAWATTTVADAEGTLKYLIGAGIDITERKHFEKELQQLNATLEQRVLERTEELQESESRFRRAVTDAPFPIMIHAEGGEVLHLSDVWTEITGYTPDEMATIGDWTKKAYGEEVDNTKAHIEKLFEMNEKVREGEFTITTKTGEQVVWDFSSSLLGRLPDGRRTVISMAMDVTERKHAEEELRCTLEELERSNKELQQFAYVASHDLQEPLRMVTSYLQLIQRRYSGRLDEEADEFIEYAVDGANRMKKLIQDLLAFSRVGTRGKPFEATPMEQILQETLQSLKLAIEEENATVTHDALPVVMADSTQLIQLMSNLIGNSIKFRGEEAPRIHIGVERQRDNWQFSIQDNGIGFDAEQYGERIFIIFQRLHTKAEYTGTGIGLAICRKIVERHGGRIWVESQPGQGSTFYFTLPVKEANHATD